MEDTPAINTSDRQARRAPVAPLNVTIPLDQDGKLPSQPKKGPIDLTVETTDASGEQPYWFDDIWWTDVIARWADEAVTVIVAPTPSALVHPVLLYQLEMLRRVVPGWRLVGMAYRTDFALDEDVRTAAKSLYHEIRIIDAARPGLPRSDRIADCTIESLLSSLRREQSAANVTSPVLVRLPAGALKSHENVASSTNESVSAS